MSEQPACLHETFSAKVEIDRITDGERGPVTSFMCHVTVTCDQCRVPFQFIGLPLGLQMRGAAMSVDGQEARLAIAPAGEVPHPLSGVEGFALKAPRLDG